METQFSSNLSLHVTDSKSKGDINDGIKERMTRHLPRRQSEEMQRQVVENEVALWAGYAEAQDKSVATSFWQ